MPSPTRLSFADLFARQPPWATLFLIAITTVVYALEWRSGPPSSQATLQKFGALIPAMVREGEWWRLVSANFVHIDISHLSFNLVSLLFLGAFLERHLGRTRMMGVFFASGLGAMAIVVAAYSVAGNDRDLVAGSSAAIFGLIGALFVWLGRTTHPASMQVRRKQRLMLLGLLLAQFTYDLWMPDISLMGHLSGLIIGWLVALAFHAHAKVPTSTGLRPDSQP